MIKENIYELLTTETKRCIEKFNFREIVYTSFDGNDMHHILAICNHVLKNEKIPLNPEMALGYYISTITLGGEKINVMKDCLTLMLLSDELWVYGKDKDLLSEGIMAEIILWNEITNKNISFIIDPYIQTIVKNSYLEIRKWLNTINKEYINDIFNNMLNQYKNKKTAYIGANFLNYKHIDWARVEAYKRGLCPVSPQNILSYYLYNSIDDSGAIYLKDRLTLLSKSDEYWLCIDTNNLEVEINRLDQNTLAELYMLSTIFVDKPIKIIDWADLNVPKYNKNKIWAITRKEQKEIMDGNYL